MDVTALGMIETVGLVSAIEAADAGLKAAEVRLLGTDYVRGGLVMVRFEGEVAAVKAAVDAGETSARRVGRVLSAHVIPRAMPEVFCMLASDVSEGPGKLRAGGCSQCQGCEGGKREYAALLRSQISAEASGSELKHRVGDDKPTPAKRGRKSHKLDVPPDIDIAACQAMKVVELRRLVRKLPGFPLTAEEIGFSSKQLLLDALATWRASLQRNAHDV